MPKKVFTPAQIVNKLRQIERLLASGKAASVVYKRAGVTEQIYRRWRKQYGGLAKRLKDQEQALKARDLDLTEALEQQIATAEILRVISGSLTDTQPVFDAIVRSCLTLFQGSRVSLNLVRDGWIVPSASAYGRATHSDQLIAPYPLDHDSISGASILDARLIHIPDLEKVIEEFPHTKEYSLKRGLRSGLSVPLMREGNAIGVILVRRTFTGSFTDKQIALLKTFADQAVIAIENVRLFKEIEARNRDLSESLSQQTATAEVLKVISSSPADVQPTFKAILESTTRVCESNIAALFLYDGKELTCAAHHNTTPEFTKVLQQMRSPPSPETPTRLAALERRVIHVDDYRNDPRFSPLPGQLRENARTVLSVPLLREGSLVGVITTWRREVKPFSDKHIALLQTFADQAVIAIENVRLFNETKEALDQQTATAEILRVISSSPTDIQPVFDAILQNAMRLCDAKLAILYSYDGEAYHLLEIVGATREYKEYLRRGPIRPGPFTGLGRVARELQPVHIHDVRTDQAYAQADPLRMATADLEGTRTLLMVPMRKESRLIGALTIYRREVRPFAEKQVALLQTFADQAVIAIENVRLFKELQARNAEITEALEQQTATAEILRVISGSLTDTQPVFDAIVRSCLTLFRGNRVNLALIRDHWIVPNVGVDASGKLPVPAPLPLDHDSPSGTSILDARVIHIPDFEKVTEEFPHVKEYAIAQGLRSGLFAPLIREGKAIGMIAVRRPVTGTFTDKEIALLRTFADQAVIAIENVRLFKELQARNAEITEALEQQTATAEILRVISGSLTDTQPVFDAIVRSCLTLFQGSRVALSLVRDGWIVPSAMADATHSDVPLNAPYSINRDSEVGTCILDARLIHMPDMEKAIKEFPRVKELALKQGFLSALLAPLMREGKAIGMIAVRRKVTGTFTDKEITLLRTFANQAVIAIENVRLFKELEARNRDLSESLEQQTATAEILKVISSSPTDTRPVFDAIVKSGFHLFGGANVSLRLIRGDLHEIVASTAPLLNADDVHPIRLDDDRTPSSRAILRREVVQVPDIPAEDWVSEKVKQRADRRGYRAMVIAPMLRENNAVGTIIVSRATPGSFTEKQMALLKIFADQAVIAIENVRLFKELDARNRDLTETLEQQTATSEILRVISSSPTDVTPVLQAVAERAARLCETDDARIWLVEGDRLVYLAGCGDVPSIYLMSIGDPRPINREWAVGRAVVDCKPVHIKDLAAESPEEYPLGVKMQRLHGHRTTLAVPLMRESKSLGAILLRKTVVQPFTETQMALVKTFADQAVIAIENVRLFKELQARNAEITEALEQQTATAEILRVISGSLTDTQPVFDAIVRNCGNLFEDSRVVLWLISDNRLYARAINSGETTSEVSIDRGSAIGVCVLDGHMVHLPDLEKAAEQYPRVRQLGLKFGYRSGIYAPLLREGRAIGSISVVRREAGAFDDKEVALLNTFADQAVIAIENVRLFREIQEKSQQLEIANRHKSEFLANMSHELRTPLNAIIGFSEVLQERMFGEMNAKQAEYIDDIHGSGKHLLSLINDILDLSKVEAGRMELELATFDLPTAISNALTLIKERAARHAIDLQSAIDPAVGEIKADERKFKQILLNLLSNSVKFTPEGGRITVAARSADSMVEVSVTDTGIGIAAEDQEAVFEEFRQVGKDYTKKAEGTGLGLALTRKFVELHGGKIRVTSVVGKGSTFTFTLPVNPTQPVAAVAH